MNSTLFVLLAASLLLAAVSAGHFDVLLRELRELDDGIPMSRPRRVPAGDKQRQCGRKLIAFVFSVCGTACTSNTGEDIATVCCATACDADYIKAACCA